MRGRNEKHKIGVKVSDLAHFPELKRNVENYRRFALKNRNFARFQSSLIDQTRRRKAGLGQIKTRLPARFAS